MTTYCNKNTHNVDNFVSKCRTAVDMATEADAELFWKNALVAYDGTSQSSCNAAESNVVLENFVNELERECSGLSFSDCHAEQKANYIQFLASTYELCAERIASSISQNKTLKIILVRLMNICHNAICNITQ